MNVSTLQSLLRSRLGLAERQAREIETEADSTGRPLEDVVVQRGLAGRNELFEMMARELNVPFVDISNYTIEPVLLATVPADIARRLQVLPLFSVAGTLTVAMSSPADINALDELRRGLKMEINPVLADHRTLRGAIAAYYPERTRASALDHAVRDAAEESELTRLVDDTRGLEEMASEAPVVRLVNELLEKSLAAGASDIHIEPGEDAMHVRVRVDGVLRENEHYPARLHAAVSSRVKILSGLDISEKRRPQDGRFDTQLGGRSVDARVSTFPTVFGENVVIRLLDKSSGPVAVDGLGMADDVAARFDNLIRQPNGLMLVTGPTGSGKTTTLYAALSALNSVEKNIVTLEDPVEYRLPLVRHCQVNPKAGITFAGGLRAILRQDPDIVMVGEIRDGETAEIAFQAALTGHLVLSTLHTNDAASALTRLTDMRIEPFLVSSTVLAILAQRLVRRNCEKCSRPTSPPPAMLERLGAAQGGKFRRGEGCAHCGNTGYRGRLGVYELLVVSPDIRDLVMAGRSASEVKERALADGMRTLRADALDKARSGLTSAEEVLRVTPDED